MLFISEIFRWILNFAENRDLEMQRAIYAKGICGQSFKDLQTLPFKPLLFIFFLGCASN